MWELNRGWRFYQTHLELLMSSLGISLGVYCISLVRLDLLLEGEEVLNMFGRLWEGVRMGAEIDIA
jgi:hypothetical protein